MTHIYVGKLTIIGSDNGLSPGRRQAIIWTNAVILLIGPLGTNFSDRNSNIFIQENALDNVVCEMASILSRPQCVILFNVFILYNQDHGCGSLATWVARTSAVWYRVPWNIPISALAGSKLFAITSRRDYRKHECKRKGYHWSNW